MEGEIPTGQEAPTQDTGADFDVDAAFNAFERGQEIPSQPEPAAAPETQPQTTAAPTLAQELAIKWNGKEIKAPIDKITHWASQGYDYSQKLQAFNQQRSEFEKQQQAFKETEARYKAVDEYVKQNPQWWDHVNQQWQQVQGQIAATNPNDPVSRELQTLKQQLQDVLSFRDQITSEKVQAQRQQEDQALTQEISSLRETYKSLDWNTIDESGRDLEMRVLAHAQEQGIKNFRAAFKDLMHDRLLQMAEERGKEKVSKDLQKRNKLGLLGQSQAPRSAIQSPQSIKEKSYDQLMREGLEELGIAMN